MNVAGCIIWHNTDISPSLLRKHVFLLCSCTNDQEPAIHKTNAINKVNRKVDSKTKELAFLQPLGFLSLIPFGEETDGDEQPAAAPTRTHELGEDTALGARASHLSAFSFVKLLVPNLKQS